MRIVIVSLRHHPLPAKHPGLAGVAHPLQEGKSVHSVRVVWPVAVAALISSSGALADENLFGYVKGAEPLPKGAIELYQQVTSRTGKGTGHYHAWDFSTELERGFTDKLAGAVYLNAMRLDTQGILIDAYLPKDKQFGLKFSGVNGELRYNVLSPARAPIGLTLYTEFAYGTLDSHSGQKKKTLSFEEKLLAQKYLLDGQLILVGNLGLEATRAKREPIADLPEGFEWPTDPEMEIEIEAAAGVSYRFAPSWFAGIEAVYEQENETEVGLERWSFQAGPAIHYGGTKWWGTLTWLPQIQGGGEKYEGQADRNLHLIEKTKYESRLKFGVNF